MKQNAARMLSTRTQIVWAAFFFIIPCTLFVLQLGSDDIQTGVVITTLATIEDRPTEDPIFAMIGDRTRWSNIVIQHLGQPAGTAEQVDRMHRNTGLDGLGYHFLIGNGNGIDDGDVHVGYRWIEQSAAARPADVDISQWNAEVISICLIGNGNRRPFTERQLLHLSRLVQRLQLELLIPRRAVSLVSDMVNTATSPGQYFAEAQFRSQLLDIPATN